MFDMTPFKRSDDGAVLWFRTEEEYNDFAGYFESEVTSLKELPSSFHSAKVTESELPALRIFYRSTDRAFDWFKGHLSRYTGGEYRILTIDDIRRNHDFGEIETCDTIDLDMLFANGG